MTGLAQVARQTIASVIPHRGALGQPAPGVRHDIGRQPVAVLPTAPLADKQARLHEGSEVARHSLPGHRQHLGQLGHRDLGTGRHPIEDLDPHRIGQRRLCVGHAVSRCCRRSVRSVSQPKVFSFSVRS